MKILKGTYSETATSYLASEFKETSISANEDGSFQKFRRQFSMVKIGRQQNRPNTLVSPAPVGWRTLAEKVYCFNFCQYVICLMAGSFRRNEFWTISMAWISPFLVGLQSWLQ